MSDVASALAELRKYAALIESLIATPAFAHVTETATALQVERGSIFPLVLSKSVPDERVERLIELTRLGGLQRVAVIDAAAHHRPLYRPLLVYAFIQSFRTVYELLSRAEFGRWEEASRAWADLLEAELGDVVWDETFTLAARGANVADVAWTALALFAAGKAFVRDAWLDLASDVFGKITRAQQPSGAFLFASASDNPETHWYHELAILHAAASYAVQAEDRTLAAAVRRATAFHMAETQPDHATTQPFGAFAFIWNPETRSFADQILHGLQTTRTGSGADVAGVLLGDALYCLRLFGSR
jgi:hypothetical protein